MKHPSKTERSHAMKNPVEEKIKELLNELMAHPSSNADVEAELRDLVKLVREERSISRAS